MFHYSYFNENFLLLVPYNIKRTLLVKKYRYMSTNIFQFRRLKVNLYLQTNAVEVQIGLFPTYCMIQA